MSPRFHRVETREIGVLSEIRSRECPAHAVLVELFETETAEHTHLKALGARNARLRPKTKGLGTSKCGPETRGKLVGIAD